MNDSTELPALAVERLARGPAGIRADRETEGRLGLVDHQALHAAREALNKLAKAAQQLAEKSPADVVLGAIEFGPFQSAWDALNDDLNTAGALGGIFTGLREATKLDGLAAAQSLAALNRMLRALGLVLPAAEKKAEIPEEIRALAEQRLAVRAAKDWAQSDVLRDQLTALGWTIKDSKDGYELTPLS